MAHDRRWETMSDRDLLVYIATTMEAQGQTLEDHGGRLGILEKSETARNAIEQLRKDDRATKYVRLGLTVTLISTAVGVALRLIWH